MKQTRTRQTPRKKAMDPGLIAFCEAYLQTFNAAESYRRSHPKAQQNSCWTLGSKTLRNVEVQAYISDRLKQMIMSSDEVLARLSDHARGSMEYFLRITDDGFAATDFSGDEAKANLHLLKKIKTYRTRRVEGRGKDKEEWEDERVELEIVDPQRALETLGKYHNLFAEKDEDGNPITDEERIARVMAILDGARARRAGQTPAGA